MSRQTPDVRLVGTRIEFAYDVTNAEPEVVPYLSVRYQPQKVTVTVIDGKIYGPVKVEGPNVKKDGTTGQNWHEARYSPGYQQDKMPAWLPEITTVALRRYADMDNAARIAEGK